MPIILLTEQERLGTTVAGRYRLDAVLGAGGMAVVFRAKHTWTGREVAVKFLDPRKTKDVETASKRFLKEGRVIGALKHPNVVKVLDMGKDEHGIVFQVLELLHGSTLARRLDEDGRLTAQETVSALLPIMDALTAAHEMEIIHRDLKPENIFISSDESGAVVPKLLDFGVAKGLDLEGEKNLTREGSVLGTPYYMAPEQAKGASTVGPRADVFSLGTVFYECLAGDLPFGDRKPAAYAVELLSRPVPSLHKHAAKVDEGIAEAIDGALFSDPSERYASMLEFRQAVSRAATNARLAVPDPAVFTPVARAALMSMRGEDSVDTLGDGTLLSDLTGDTVPPARRRRRLIGVALVGVLAAVLTFAIVGRGSDEDVSASPTPVGSEPTAASAGFDSTGPAVSELPPEQITHELEEQGEQEEGEVEAEEFETPVIRRLVVKRTTFPRSPMRRPPTMDVVDAASTEAAPEPAMRRDRPNVVREF